MQFKNGEKSAQVLKSTGFENATFKAYNGSVTMFLQNHLCSIDEIAYRHDSHNSLLRTGSATIPSLQRWMMSANFSLRR